MKQNGKEKKLPGIMLYNDCLSAIRFLSLQKKGMLLDAVITYQLDGEIPEVTKEIKLLWEMMYPRLQLDRQKYMETSRRRQYAAYTGDMKRRGLEPLPFEAWDEEKRAAEEVPEPKPGTAEDKALVEYWQQRVRDQIQARGY